MRKHDSIVRMARLVIMLSTVLLLIVGIPAEHSDGTSKSDVEMEWKDSQLVHNT